MQLRWVGFLALGLLACNGATKDAQSSEPSPDSTTNQSPDLNKTVLEWRVDGPQRGIERFILKSSGQGVYLARSPDGTDVRVERQITEAEYAALQKRLRDLSCCSLKAGASTPTLETEARPSLRLDFPTMQCTIRLWDGEWSQGQARECGFLVAGLHGRGFVPDPPLEDKTE